MQSAPASYVGRFAPSPTGPLHLGSLATAVASYLHARQRSGQWLVRIEDIDPPRESPGAADAILSTLEAFGLDWDGSVLYQSTRQEVYEARVRDLLAAGLAFRCSCSRRALRLAGHGPYPGTCRAKRLLRATAAVRARVEPREERFVDGLQGEISDRLDRSFGDYVIWRRDALPAYHLAVVVDDAAQGVTDIVRGVDLLDSTFVHLHLQRALGLPSPHYWHLPVVVDEAGQKLSKQTGARALDDAQAAATAARVLELLGAPVPATLRGAPPAELWQWAQDAWRAEGLRGIRELTAPAC